MNVTESIGVHVVVGGLPAGESAGHDMDYARLRILELLDAYEDVHATVANDYGDVEKWLTDRHLLVSYCLGPYLNFEENEFVRKWLRGGGRWLALHGSSVGKRVRLLGQDGWGSESTGHCETLGSVFMHHPPIRKFTVDVVDPNHPLTFGLPASFEVMDELYFLDLHDPTQCHFFLTTDLPKDPTPARYTNSEYDESKSLLSDGRSRPLGYIKEIGKGGITYIALGHCHSPSTNRQPNADSSVASDGKTPLLFRGPWETEPFEKLLGNAISWGLGK